MQALESVAKETRLEATTAIVQTRRELEDELNMRCKMVEACRDQVDTQRKALESLIKQGQKEVALIQKPQKHLAKLDVQKPLAAVQRRAEVLARQLVVVNTTLKLRKENEKCD